MRRVLVVDDEPHIRAVLRGYLEADGFAVSEAADGEEAVRQVRRDAPDLVLLDVMLPGFDGIEALRQVRTFSDVYVILVTARTEEVDKLVGLGVGADDYVTKPFSPREVAARVKAVLRRDRAVHQAGAAVLRFDGLTVDPGTREVQADGAPIGLSALEFDLLAALAEAPGRVFSRRQLLERVWGYDFFGDERVVDVHIRSLRARLGDDAANPRLIRHRPRGWLQVRGAARMRMRLPVRLFISYAVVAVIGAAVTYVTVRLLAPTLFDQHMNMLGGDHMGMGGQSGSAGSVHSAFISALTTALLVGVLASVATAGLAAAFVTSRLLRPLDAVRAATRRIAAGHYQASVPVPEVPELAALAGDVNTLAAELASTEARRTRLLGEVAHEMRTPLTALGGYVEGLIDGVFAPEPEILGAVSDELRRLGRLADDLSALSRAEEQRLDLHPADADLARPGPAGGRAAGPPVRRSPGDPGRARGRPAASAGPTPTG